MRNKKPYKTKVLSLPYVRGTSFASARLSQTKSMFRWQRSEDCLCDTRSIHFLVYSKFQNFYINIQEKLAAIDAVVTSIIATRKIREPTDMLVIRIKPFLSSTSQE